MFLVVDTPDTVGFFLGILKLNFLSFSSFSYISGPLQVRRIEVFVIPEYLEVEPDCWTQQSSGEGSCNLEGASQGSGLDSWNLDGASQGSRAGSEVPGSSWEGAGKVPGTLRFHLGQLFPLQMKVGKICGNLLDALQVPGEGSRSFEMATPWPVSIPPFPIQPACESAVSIHVWVVHTHRSHRTVLVPNPSRERGSAVDYQIWSKVNSSFSTILPFLPFCTILPCPSFIFHLSFLFLLWAFSLFLPFPFFLPLSFPFLPFFPFSSFSWSTNDPARAAALQ